MLKYGMLAKGVELMCFKPALGRLVTLLPDMDIKVYKKKVKQEYKAMLLRTPDIGGSSLEANLVPQQAVETVELFKCDFRMLCQKKSYQQIIASASRPIENLDNRLTLDGFKNWYFEKIQCHN